MPLRGRVGRHTKLEGRHTQNNEDDQRTVIALLNRIPVADGGTGGSLGGPIKRGMASDALYRAIVAFEDKHFPGQRSGFVDPDGAMLKRMEALTARRPASPAAAAPAPPHCEVITLPPLMEQSSLIRTVLNALDVQLPTRARCLDRTEVDAGKEVYGESLAYDDIYVADSIGMSGRPLTTALKLGSRWSVVLNMGPDGFEHPNRDAPTLIHELAHAWQSQHHPDDPMQYMLNCVRSQVDAEVATAVDSVSKISVESLKLLKRFALHRIAPGFNPKVNLATLGEASAYAYVPGWQFHEYGGEQIASQIEDSRYPPRAVTDSTTARTHVARVGQHVRSVPRGVKDLWNIMSLSVPRYAHKNFQNVVWHK